MPEIRPYFTLLLARGNCFCFHSPWNPHFTAKRKPDVYKRQTVDGTGVRIYNAKDADILADVTTGAYAYQLNPVDGETSYCLTREFDFSSAEAVKFSFDSKVDGAFAGALKVYASVGDGAWNELKTVAPTNDWSKTEVDLSAYAGQEMCIRDSLQAALHSCGRYYRKRPVCRNLSGLAGK